MSSLHRTLDAVIGLSALVGVEKVLRSVPDRASFLPDVALSEGGHLASALERRGVSSFRDAGRYVRSLPYGRPSERPAFLHVVGEGRGTCSSKHACIAALAREVGIGLRLMLGVFDMDEANTPGVGPVLAAANVASLPEAHCWIEMANGPVDLTKEGADADLAKRRFRLVQEITPEQSEAYKQSFHRTAFASCAAATALGFEAGWALREECIAALADR